MPTFKPMVSFRVNRAQPTVLIDEYVLRRYKGGIWRIASELLGALTGVQPTWNVITVPARSINNLELNQPNWRLKNDNRVSGKVFSWIDAIFSYTIWPQFAVSMAAIRQHADVIICPNYVFPILLSRRCLVLIHDINVITKDPLAGYRSPRTKWSFSGFSIRCYFWVIRRFIKLASKRCGGVVVPTNKVRDDIFRSFPEISVPVFVINWGIDKEWFDDRINDATQEGETLHRSTLQLQDKLFVLCVNPHSYKNIELVLQAVAHINHKNSDRNIMVGIKVVGHLEESSQLQTDFEYLGRVPEAELRALYRTALAVGIGTVDSGFGFPLLEALASGCPCIIREGTAEAEVAAGHGVIVVDENVNSWVTALEKLIFNPTVRLAMSIDAAKWASTLSWERMGSNLAQAIDQMRRS